MTPINSPSEQERILSLSDEILRDVESLQFSVDSKTVPLNKKAIDAITREFLKNDDMNYSFPVNGSVDCFVSDDQMEAYLTLYPPTPGMAFVTLEDVQKELHRCSVSYGIQWDELETALNRCNLENITMEGIVVARGNPPQSEIQRHYIPEQRLLSKEIIEPGNEARIDFKEISPFILVTKGERLGNIVQGQEGKDGKNVLGNIITKKKELHDNFLLGQNIEERDDCFYSGIDGVLDITGKKITVKEVLLIKDNVDYHTGNIDFSGDVIIHGEVQEGFTIKAGGSVYAKQALSVTNFECGGNLNVKFGIIGRKDGLVKVSGEVKAKFVENTLIEAGGNIDITSSILRSSIYTGGCIHCGPKSMIIGGTYYAQNGVRANQIGSESAPHTEIYCGLDYTIMKQLAWNKDQSLNLALALQKLKKMIPEAQSEKIKADLAEKFNKIKEAISKINAISSTLVFHLDKNETAAIEVTGRIYPGVYLEICHVSYVVKKPMTMVRFILDKEAGIIRAERHT